MIGHPSTLPVTLDQMLRSPPPWRGSRRALVVATRRSGSYQPTDERR